MDFSAPHQRIGALCTLSLLLEVSATPKPGLVDRLGSGAHTDMDFSTFLASAAAIAPYFTACAQAGLALPQVDGASLGRIRPLGMACEKAMLAATGGVNTHKGAIFSLGTICGAVGRLWRAEAPCRDPESILKECADMVSAAVEEDFTALSPDSARTAGERAYLERGFTGVRGEAAQGFPGVLHTALPVLESALKSGRSKNDAGVIALLYLIARGTDTNMVSRGGPERAKKAAEDCTQLLERSPLPEMEEIARLDQEFIRDNLSPGGCADLLAAAFFLLSWNEVR